jgi:hypothetical protein
MFRPTKKPYLTGSGSSAWDDLGTVGGVPYKLRDLRYRKVTKRVLN